MSVARIPLFPLNVVLFPGQSLPLHIFEPRYRLMCRHCIDTGSAFGIVFIYAGRPARTGCTALIVDVLKRHSDGRSDILVTGERPFRLMRTYNEQPYFEADVRYMEDEQSEREPAVYERLSQLFARCHRAVFEVPSANLEPPPAVSPSYWVASELPIDLAFRQRLLDSRSEADRQRLLVERLAQWCPQLEKRRGVHAGPARNGNGTR